MPDDGPKYKSKEYEAINKDIDNAKKYVDTNHHIAHETYRAFVNEFLKDGDNRVDYSKLNSLDSKTVSEFYENKLSELYKKVDPNFDPTKFKDKSGKDALMKHYFGVSPSELKYQFAQNPAMLTQEEFTRTIDQHKRQKTQERYQSSILEYVGTKPSDELKEDVKNMILKKHLPEGYSIDDKLLEQSVSSLLMEHHLGALNEEMVRLKPYVTPPGGKPPGGGYKKNEESGGYKKEKKK